MVKTYFIEFTSEDEERNKLLTEKGIKVIDFRCREEEIEHFINGFNNTDTAKHFKTTAKIIKVCN